MCGFSVSCSTEPPHLGPVPLLPDPCTWGRGGPTEVVPCRPSPVDALPSPRTPRDRDGRIRRHPGISYGRTASVPRNRLPVPQQKAGAGPTRRPRTAPPKILRGRPGGEPPTRPDGAPTVPTSRPRRSACRAGEISERCPVDGFEARAQWSKRKRTVKCAPQFSVSTRLSTEGPGTTCATAQSRDSPPHST